MAILFRNGVQTEPITIAKNEKGKKPSLYFRFEKQIFQKINIYAPKNPSSRKNSYKNIINHIDKNNNQNLILTGDFNVAEDIYLDRQGETPSNLHLIGLPYLHKIKQKYNLRDT